MVSGSSRHGDSGTSTGSCAEERTPGRGEREDFPRCGPCRAEEFANDERRRISPDFRELDIEMAHFRWNTNRNETHFDGSLLAMTDGMYMMILMENLGPDYIIWDKSASIRFRRPAKSAVRAEFRLSAEQIDAVRRAADTHPKVEPTWKVDIRDYSGEVVAVVERTMSVKRRQDMRPPT